MTQHDTSSNPSKNSHAPGPVAPPPNPEWTGEQGRRPLPLRGYAMLLGIYATSSVSLFWWAHRRGRLLKRVPLADLGVLAVGSHTLARMASKDRVTTVLRRPFTEYQGTQHAKPGEADERARHDHGPLRQAVGELLTCPFCMTTWATSALFASYLADRRLGRSIAALLSTVSAAEMMQSAYGKVVR